MAHIPNDITQIEDARHWCRVNGYSAEATDAMVAEWMGNPAPIAIEEELDASPEPEVVESDEEEEEDWDYEDDEESEDEE